MRHEPLAIPAILALAMAACHHHDLGTGANTVDRDYARPVGKVWQASVDSAKDAGLEVLSAKGDALGGTLVARRSSGDEVRIVVNPLQETRSRVSVRVGPGDLALARLLHERIAEGVGLGEARTGLFGGHSLEGRYDPDLTACTLAGRRMLQALKLEITREETHALWTTIDARTAESIPVRLKCEIEGTKTHVRFVAGEARTDDALALARRMKEEFEKNVGFQGN
jgi:hypothetical protein